MTEIQNRLRPVVLLQRNINQINVRECGFPTGAFTGKTWRSEKHRIIICTLPDKYEVRDLLIADRADQQWVPISWRKAMLTYKQDWPNSAPMMYGM